MVGPSPRCLLVSLGAYFHPFFGLPVKKTDCIESLLVGSTSSEKDESIVVFIEVHGAVRPERGYISCCLYFIPFHGDGVEGP